MKWLHIDSARRKQPKTGKWNDWKEQIASDCGNQCIYCAIPEADYGGIDNFHVEHFRPKSVAAFKSLINTITNLYLACAICNRFKSNDWPNDPDAKLSIPSYPDPEVVDYDTLFNCDDKRFLLTGRFIASKYVVERLYLNRPQLLRLRRLCYLESRLLGLQEEVIGLVSAVKPEDDAAAAPFYKEAVLALGSIVKDIAAIRHARPYSAADVKKVKRRGGVKRK